VDVQTERVNAIAKSHKNQKKALIAILQDVQAEYNFLPQAALRAVARSLGIPLIDVIGVATFYRALSLKPRGRYVITICMGTACHVRGGPKILEEFERRLDLKSGDTTKDGHFTLETVACLGCCAIGPVVVVNEEYTGHVTIQKVNKIIAQYSRPEPAAAAPKKAKPAKSLAS
jgi:NADH:ubiquinone oxidoreductase subunit E